MEEKKLEMEIEKLTEAQDEELRQKNRRLHELNEKFKNECQVILQDNTDTRFDWAYL